MFPDFPIFSMAMASSVSNFATFDAAQGAEELWSSSLQPWRRFEAFLHGSAGADFTADISSNEVLIIWVIAVITAIYYGYRTTYYGYMTTYYGYITTYYGYITTINIHYITLYIVIRCYKHHKHFVKLHQLQRHKKWLVDPFEHHMSHWATSGDHNFPWLFGCL